MQCFMYMYTYSCMHTHIFASINLAFDDDVDFASRSAVLFLETLLPLLGNHYLSVDLNMTS